MRMTDIIYKKKHKQVLSENEIKFFVDGYVNDIIPDYQVSALLMAIWFNGMNERETVSLTKAMVESGDTIDLSFMDGIKVDKHSTGGIGDKISLIVAPIVASLGVPVAKMSGRGLGFTGGTIDKLESIEGFNTSLSIDQFKENVEQHGICIIGQTGNLVPADKKLYALRDVTETVDSIPLIASSIMSKKISSGADAIVLDVKVGKGAFMKTVEEAEILAKTMVDIGGKLNRKMIAILSNMDQPLGNSVGNKIELQEVVKLLRDHEGEDDLIRLAVEIATYMYYLSGKTNDVNEAGQAVSNALYSGNAYRKFVEFVKAQGGSISSLEENNVKYQFNVLSDRGGYVHSINSEEVGWAAMMLGAGRQTKNDAIDHEVGIKMNIKVGICINKGDSLFTIYSNKEHVEDIQRKLLNSVEISNEHIDSQPIIYKVISK